MKNMSRVFFETRRMDQDTVHHRPPDTLRLRRR